MTAMEARTSSENVTSRFCNQFLVIQSCYAWKMCSNCPGIKLEQALGVWEDKIEHLSSYADIVHTTAKQVISRRRKNENVFKDKMSKDEICMCKACKNTVCHCQVCKFMGFLLPSSSWLLKLPIAETKSYIFRRRSRFRPRHVCLSSLIIHKRSYQNVFFFQFFLCFFPFSKSSFNPKIYGCLLFSEQLRCATVKTRV